VDYVYAFTVVPPPALLASPLGRELFGGVHFRQVRRTLTEAEFNDFRATLAARNWTLTDVKRRAAEVWEDVP
jgi:hypothetical protein